MTHTDPRPLPFAVFDEFGKPADDRVQDHIYAALSEVLGDSQPTPPSWMDREPVAKIKPSQKSMRELLSEAALGDSQPVALTVVDIADDDALRFACRCLGAGSYPPGEDRETARNGLMAIRTRLRASHQRAEPASVQALREADRIFCWLERRTIYQDSDIKAVHAKIRAVLAAHPSTDQNHSG